MQVMRILLFTAVFILPIQKFYLPGNTALVDFINIPIIILSWGIFLKNNKVIRLPLAFPQWAILVGSQIASFNSIDPSLSVLTLIQDIYLFIWFITLVNIIEEKRLLRRIIEIWIVSAVVISIIIVIAYVSKSSYLIPLAMKGTGRAIGTFRNPNLVASYLLTSFFIYLSIPFPRERLLRLIIGLLLIFAMLITGSNAAIMGFVGGMGAWLVQRLTSAKRSFLPFALLALVLATVSVILYVPPFSNLPERVVSFASSFTGRTDLLGMSVGRSQRGLAKRIRIWEDGYKLFLEKPLGIGPGNAHLSMGLETHNDLMSYLLERGPIGLVGLLLMVIEILRCLKQLSTLKNSYNYTDWPIISPLIGAFLTNILFGLTHEVFHFRHLWLLFAVIFTLNKLSESVRREVPQLVSTQDDGLRAAHGKGNC